MAFKGKTEGSERPNRLRFVMLEADLNDANVNVLAHAIMSALRSEAPSTAKRVAAPTGVTARLGAPAAQASNGRGHQPEGETPNSPAEEGTPDLPFEDIEPRSETVSVAPTRARKPSKPTQPKYLDDLFPSVAEGDEFKTFIQQHATNKDSERYLVAALYLRDHGHAIVNLDKIYTCYRLVSWPMAIRDWDMNLRNQLRNDRFRRADGGYAITTAGENVVRELSASA